jgi:hypothetical protein
LILIKGRFSRGEATPTTEGVKKFLCLIQNFALLLVGGYAGAIALFLFPWLVVFATAFILAGDDLRRIFSRDGHNSNHLQVSGISILLISIFTTLLLQFEIPAKLYFYTSADEFKRILVGQVLNKSIYNIKHIGNIEVNEIVIENSERESSQDKYVYFVTHETRDFIEGNRQGYGFAYFPDLPKNSTDEITHIDGKWYIFHRKRI